MSDRSDLANFSIVFVIVMTKAPWFPERQCWRSHHPKPRSPRGEPFVSGQSTSVITVMDTNACFRGEVQSVLKLNLCFHRTVGAVSSTLDPICGHRHNRYRRRRNAWQSCLLSGASRQPRKRWCRALCRGKANPIVVLQRCGARLREPRSTVADRQASLRLRRRFCPHCCAAREARSASPPRPARARLHLESVPPPPAHYRAFFRHHPSTEAHLHVQGSNAQVRGRYCFFFCRGDARRYGRSPSAAPAERSRLRKKID